MPGSSIAGRPCSRARFGGKEVVAILEKPTDAETIVKYEYRLLASSKTSTTQKELEQAGDQGFEFVGLTVARTFAGGAEVVTILRRKL